MEEGFVKGSSENLPKVDLFIVDEFYANNLDFLSAEMRNVKTARAARHSYDYVQLKCSRPVCTIKAKITPEHRVHKKNYIVEAEINEEEESALRCECISCSASSGGCKHGVAGNSLKYLNLAGLTR